MAPEVAVPANFGKHHLKSRTHNNLELLCAEGEVQRANSMILSLNSSVIEDLIARLEITSLDMQDFAAPAVNCFVESMYSGELENCDKTNFRDLNKMGHVFDVTWFVERCLKYFTELVDQVTGKCYEDILFLAEEAWFFEENLKKCKLMDVVIDKLNRIGNKKSLFLKQHTTELGELSISQLKMVVRLAGADHGILAAILSTHLKIAGASTLTENSRFLFQKIDFVKCLSNARYFDLTNDLFEILSSNCNEDFTSAVTWISSFTLPSNMDTAKKNVAYAKKFPVMVDLPIEDFLEFDWDSLCDFLSRSDKIQNLYQFFDAVYAWLFMSHTDEDTEAPRLDLSDKDILCDIIDAKRDRCWAKISRKYLDFFCNRSKAVGADKLVNLFSECNELSCSDGMLFVSEDFYNIDDLFDMEDSEISMASDVRGQKVASCTREESECGFMLKLVLEKKDENIKQFCLEIMQTDHDEDSSLTDTHYHDFSSKTQIINLFMDVTSEDNEFLTPLPFNCIPCKDDNEFWYWGFHQFCGHHKLDCEIPFKFSFGNDAYGFFQFFAILSW